MFEELRTLCFRDENQFSQFSVLSVRELMIDIILGIPVVLPKWISNDDKEMSAEGRWIWLRSVCAPFTPAPHPKHETRTVPVPIWVTVTTTVGCHNGEHAALLDHRASMDFPQDRANTSKHGGVYVSFRDIKTSSSRSRSFLREESSIVPTYGGHWRLFQSRTCVKPRIRLKILALE